MMLIEGGAKGDKAMIVYLSSQLHYYTGESGIILDHTPTGKKKKSTVVVCYIILGCPILYYVESKNCYVVYIQLRVFLWRGSGLVHGPSILS